MLSHWQLIYYIRLFFICQELFSKLFRSFWSNSLKTQTFLTAVSFETAYLLYQTEIRLSRTFFVLFKPFFRSTAAPLSDSFNRIPNPRAFVKYFFQIFSGISECAKCSAFVFRCVHILFMIHSKNFHSLIMPNSFFPFILQNVKNVAEIFHWHLIHMSFSQYFNTIWIYFFHNCQAALCLASSLFRAFFIFSFLCTQGNLLRLR